jgi:hypothetical protein
MTPDLRTAYENAHYVVFEDPPIVLRIGERNAQLEALMEADGASTAAYLTPANPRDEVWTPEENEAALFSLHDALRDSRYTCFPGEGRDPVGERMPEPSLLVVGISRADAEEMGMELEQNAIVFIEKGRAPELVYLVE